MTTVAGRLRPGGALATRPLHFFWLADTSGSMSQDGKIQALNNAVREAIPHMRNIAGENPHARILVRALQFSSGAHWHLPTPTPIDQFQWPDLRAEGTTDLGQALQLLTEQLKTPPMDDRALPPVIVLVSDGQPTDDYAPALHAMNALPWGKKAVRVAIAIGEDAHRDILQEFVGSQGPPPLQANNPEMLVAQIRWVSTAVLQSASSPTSQSATPNNTQGKTQLAPLSNVPIPQPPPPQTGGDVW